MGNEREGFRSRAVASLTTTMVSSFALAGQTSGLAARLRGWGQ
jgi:hypothetical protein